MADNGQGLKIAYLILGYRQPIHLARLVHALQDNDSYFFIHIDKKSNLDQFKNLLHYEKNVLFINQRVRICWGGFSMVKAILYLLKTATGFQIDFKYYCLLSDADFPIKSKKQIKQLFAGKRQFIRIDRRLSGPERNYHFIYIERYHFSDNYLLDSKRELTHFYEKLARFLLSTMSCILNYVLPKRAFIKRVTPYHGSQWWCLTKECVRYILDFIATNPDYVRFFRFVFASDEIFFHTIVKLSPFAEDISHDFEKSTASGNDHGGHYIAWKYQDSLSPETLDESDFKDLMESNALFARKFDEKKSKSLIARLEKQLQLDNPT
ncbi:MAG: hypothetical protein JRI96_14425 [Deltaproteobacteria bacterium]|nr:hypothetical protein [Deltaproteobacteria bacterium]